MTTARRRMATAAAWLGLELADWPDRRTILLAGIAGLAAAAWSLAAAASGATTSPGTGLALAVATILFAIVVAAAVLDAWLGLLAWIVAMAPLSVARLGVTLDGLLVTQTTLVLVAIGLGLAIRPRGRPGLHRVPARVVAIAAIASALALISGVAAADRALGLTIALHGIVEPALVLVLVVGLATTPDRVRALAAAMVVSVTLATLYNLERLFRITFDLSIAQADRTAFARFTYYNVGIFGDMLVMTLPLAIVLVLEARARGWPRRGRAVMAAVAATLGIGLYLTFTKGPWLAGVITLAALFVVVARTWRRRALVVVATLVLASLIVPYPSYLLQALNPDLGKGSLAVITAVQGGSRADSWDPETAEGEVSIHERLLATEAAFAMAIDHPLVGVGPGGFAAAYADGYRPAGATRALGSAHDMLPDVAAEYGIPLAVVLALAIVAVLLAAWRTIRRRGRGWLLGLGLGAAFVAFLIVGVSFGVDLYRPWRVMNSDVVFAALLAGAILGLARTTSVGVAGPGSAALVDRSTHREARV